ncbi:MAG TPA: aryl-sulfate sulfotransferase, partial [Marmoricola sp.]|nr:aryl-sulfate sulfotransferase [Marmoricola sp.]
YGVRPGAANDGSIWVTATPASNSGRVFINGAPATGPTQVTGLVPGSEISVIFDDTLGRSVHSLIYLSPDFPELTATNAPGGLTPQAVAITLNRFSQDAPNPRFEAIVDRWGVPFWTLRQNGPSGDLKQQLGQWTVIRQLPDETGVTVLDEFMRPIRTYLPQGGPVDGHDSVMLPNGGALLLSYPPNQVTGRIDAMIQEINSNNQVVFSWNSNDHVDPNTESVVPGTNADYAHINSIQVLPGDGDLLASFRNLSAVFRIARVAHDGYQPGDVIWRFGGRRSDFNFEPGEDGPCAQHTATLHPDGRLVLFDNSPNSFWGNLCVDQDDPSGSTYSRSQTRITEYSLDEDTMEAVLASTYSRPGYAAGFAGSAYRMANGNTLIGWGGEKQSIAQEINDSGEILWDLADTTPTVATPRFGTYRAHAATWTDHIPPSISLSLPDGQSVAKGNPLQLRVNCTDRGGSALDQCGLQGEPVLSLDTQTLGSHHITLTATDLDGNSTSKVFTWHVVPSQAPGLDVRRSRTGPDLLTLPGALTLPRGKLLRARVRITNHSPRHDALVFRSSHRKSRIQINWRSQGRKVTRSVNRGHWTTRKLRPGESQVLTLVLRTKRGAPLPVPLQLNLSAQSRSTGLGSNGVLMLK